MKAASLSWPSFQECPTGKGGCLRWGTNATEHWFSMHERRPTNTLSQRLPRLLLVRIKITTHITNYSQKVSSFSNSPQIWSQIKFAVSFPSRPAGQVAISTSSADHALSILL